jgi:hypothetical protein
MDLPGDADLLFSRISMNEHAIAAYLSRVSRGPSMLWGHLELRVGAAIDQSH